VDLEGIGRRTGTMLYNEKAPEPAGLGSASQWYLGYRVAVRSAECTASLRREADDSSLVRGDP